MNQISPAVRFALPALLLLGSTFSARAVTWSEVEPLFQTYCVSCHNAEEDEGNFNLEKFRTEADLFRDFAAMEDMKWVTADKEMPPRKADEHPTDEERRKIVDYLEQSLIALSNAQPKDPGVVPMPRVNPHQFDYIVEDLTGYDLNLGQYLTPDGSSKEGFVHFGALQTMSVGQFEGFLSTSKKLLGYARVVPETGIVWSQTPLPTATTKEELKEKLIERWKDWHVEEGKTVAGDHIDRVKRVLDVQEKHWSFQPVLESYLEAVWQYENRAALGMPDATIADVAAGYSVPLFPGSLEYARNLMLAPEVLREGDDFLENPIFRAYREKFHAIPGPEGSDKTGRRDEFGKLAVWREAAGSEFDGMFLGELTLDPEERADRQQLRGLFHRGTPRLDIDVASSTSGRVHLSIVPVFGSDWNPSLSITTTAVRMKDGSEKSWSEALSITNQDGAAVSPDGEGVIVLESPAHLVIEPKGDVKSIHAEAEYVKSDQDGPAAVRIGAFSEAPEDPILSFAGCQLVGGSSPRHSSRMKQVCESNLRIDDGGPPTFKRNDDGEFIGLPEEVVDWAGVSLPDRARGTRGMLFSFSPRELASHATERGKEEREQMLTTMKALAAAENMTEAELENEVGEIASDLALVLWRRLPSAGEKEALVELFRKDRAEGRSFDASAKTTLTAVLMSPEFLYRVTRARGKEEPYLLSDVEIATRLAFTLWGRVPDRELLKIAYDEKLKDAETYYGQIERMISDPRIEAFVEQFTGMWLGFADFDKFTGPDAEKYEQYDKPLREAMHAEAKHFFLDLLRNDGAITEAFTADYTYLNERLAEHYGIDGVKGSEMRRVKLEDTSQRGGILGMGAFLTKYSQPLRTSPVHRGIWLYEHVLGLPIPPPPPNVAQLSDEETNEEGLTVAQQLEIHRDKAECSSCHEKFDPLGVAMENFDPIGAWRTTTGGKPVDSDGRYKNGDVIKGLDGLREYVAGQEDQFLEHFSEVLLAYCLGRELLPTDRPTVQELVAALEQNDHSFRVALRTALASPQFVKRRDVLEHE